MLQNPKLSFPSQLSLADYGQSSCASGHSGLEIYVCFLAGWTNNNNPLQFVLSLFQPNKAIALPSLTSLLAKDPVCVPTFANRCNDREQLLKALLFWDPSIIHCE